MTNLEQIDAAINRWETRLFRASNALQKLRAQKRRALLATSKKPPVVIVTVDKAKPPGQQVVEIKEPKNVTEVTELTSSGGFGITLDDPLDIRNQPWAKNEADEKAKAELLAQREEQKKAHAKAVAERRRARLSGESRQMPLQGKAALAKIRASFNRTA